MRRALFAGAVIAAAIWGSAIGAAPGVSAEPVDDFCTAWNADGSCYYANCTDAMNHGECDIKEGSAHYCPQQDRDGDGIACECPN